MAGIGGARGRRGAAHKPHGKSLGVGACPRPVSGGRGGGPKSPAASQSLEMTPSILSKSREPLCGVGDTAGAPGELGGSGREPVPAPFPTGIRNPGWGGLRFPAEMFLHPCKR